MTKINYKYTDANGNIITVYNNDAYEFYHIQSLNNNSAVNLNYKTDDMHMINLELLGDLIKSCNKINDIIILLKQLVAQNIITIDVYNYICNYVNDLENDKIKTKKS